MALSNGIYQIRSKMTKEGSDKQLRMSVRDNELMSVDDSSDVGTPSPHYSLIC
jgi:hypothetical protein